MKVPDAVQKRSELKPLPCVLSGPYWIGAKEKALNPMRYSPGELEFSEMVVVVPVGAFVTVALVQTGYAP